MSKELLEAMDLKALFTAGADELAQHAAEVDMLNVFPVPDGDTGTNMSLTFSAAIAELDKYSYDYAGDVAQELAKGLLMGARGNSGVILSQLFSGFSKGLKGCKQISSEKLARALQQGVTVAYDAVVKPVEGTILTVAREAAEAAVVAARHSEDLSKVMEAALRAAHETLTKTPDMLPVLKEAGVVDSGGQGLVHIYTGFCRALSEEFTQNDHSYQRVAWNEAVHAQTHLKTENIEYGFCTEILLKLKNEDHFQVTAFRSDLSRFGDSLLVVVDEDLVKVHIHSEHPGDVISFAQQFGELLKIKAENMREQHLSILKKENQNKSEPEKAFGIVTVCAGNGFANIFKSIGADAVVLGGSSMNPSTEALYQAARGIRAQTIFFLPNHKNTIMAAKQAASLLEKPGIVIESTTLPEGISAVLALRMDAAVEENRSSMCHAMSRVKSGKITTAVRDTIVGQVVVKEGDIIGIANGEIILAGISENDVLKRLVTYLVDDHDELLTIYYGQDITSEQAAEVFESVRKMLPELEMEMQDGGQPLYSYILSIE